VERGEVGANRGAHGLPGRRRHGYGPRDGTEGAGAGGANRLEDAEDDDYGQLLRRPGELPPYQQRLRQPGGPRTPQPGRFPPSADHPASGQPPGSLPPGGFPLGGFPGDGDLASRSTPNRTAPGGPVHSGPMPGRPVSGGPVPGRQYRTPDGRLIPPDADRPYRPRAPGPADGNPGRPGPTRVRIPGQNPLGGIRVRPDRPSQPPGAPSPGAPGGQQAHGGAPGSRAASGVSRNSGFVTSQAPGRIRDVPVAPEPVDLAGPAGPVIRQRETAVPERPPGQTLPVASIAPDGLESFARDLRALRATAELDYPEMAELSHFTMRTLASAAAGLRLPTLPVAVAYVRVCGGDVAEWEERWQKLATKVTADEARKRRSDGDDEQAPPEPADSSAIGEPPPAAAAAPEPDFDPGEVYVITSAKPREPGWPAEPGGPAEAGPGGVWGIGGPGA
jgi:hypothetical protein